MNPEQRLFVIVEYFTVEFLIVLLTALIRMFCPQRMSFIDRNRTFYDFQFFCPRRNFYDFFFTVFVFLLFCLCLFDDRFNDSIRIQFFFRKNSLILSLCILIYEINFCRHERAIFCQNFFCTVLVGKLQAIFI